MKNLLRYIPMHILLCVIFGIYIQHKYSLIITHNLILFLGVCLFLIFLNLVRILKRTTYQKFSFALCFIVLGMTTKFITNDMNSKKFYTNFLSSENTIVLEISNQLKSNSYSHKFIANIIQVNDKSSSGKVILYLDKSYDFDTINFSHLIIPQAKLQYISNAKNPHEFNYAEYLKNQGIIHQLHLNKGSFTTVKNDRISLSKFVLTLRKQIQKSLKKYSFSKDQLAVTNALLLGQRQDLSSELKENYTKAGAIHILAISGLHIGIVCYLLNFLLTCLLPLKKSKYLRVVLTLILLWFFAFFTGMSASVVRATTMFTFIMIGNQIKRNQPVEFSLVSSMLCILLVEPMFLFDIGFQLSYLAVFGIIWIQPLLKKLWTPRTFFLNKFWKLTTVSMAAQISTLPISLYYFHQFPSLFLIANLFIIPCIGFILSLGLIVLILAYCEILPEFLVTLYSSIISWMNLIISKVASYEDFIFSHIHLPFRNMILYYIIMLIIISLLKKFKLKLLFILLGCILCLQSLYIFQRHEIKSQQEIIVFHKNKHSLIGIRNSNSIDLISNLDSLAISKLKFFDAYKTKENIKNHTKSSKKEVIGFLNYKYLIIDSLAIYPKKKLENTIVILKNSPKLNLERLIKEINPKLIISDGSNYKSYIKRWSEICAIQKTPFHNTNEDGAYILKK
ncbi:ComEC/Rec2 family competence protein [Tenacibaculum jejuense]|uniref:Competence protein n=1 Tax=Tenacibaculum jejuense TaxID=584609 RepID=A0A238U6T4_9FLAO|nr:ComEC/Rec2 family competence protein [Tenacibaculum jejuense]SNR14812.1 Probable transmembrane protein of unknown function [Tenacibaculum jejuense]